MDDSIDTITSTLLSRVRARDPKAWKRLVELYGPLIYYWLLKKLSREDAEDVGQEVFLAISRGLESYKHENFRGWLRTITERKILDYWDKNNGEPHAQGGSDFQKRINDVPDDSSSGNSESDLAERKIVRLSILDSVRDEFSDQDLKALRRVIVDEKSAAEVAAELGMTKNQVYLAKSRILKRLREKFGEDRP